MAVLSERMKAICRMVTPGNRVCDVGCDHGYVAIELVESGRSPSALAMDIKKGPLESAFVNIEKAGLQDRIETRLSDGLTELHEGETDTVIMAGMGGPLMESILVKAGDRLPEVKEFVFGPQSDFECFRRRLRQLGLVTVCEDMIYEEGKYYPLIKAVHGTVQHCGSEEEQLCFDRYGEYLLRSENQVLLNFLRWEEEHFAELERKLRTHRDGSPKAEARLAELMRDRRVRALAFSYYADSIDGTRAPER